MATKKKTTKKLIKKPSTKKVVKKIKKIVPKKKVAKKTTSSKRTSSRKIPQGEFTIQPIYSGSVYWQNLAQSINNAIQNGFEKINYCDEYFGLRLTITKNKKVVVETGYSNNFANRAIPNNYEMAEYALNKKKILTIGESIEEDDD